MCWIKLERLWRLDKISMLIEKILDEPLAQGEPDESIQLGRLQVADEVQAILDTNCPEPIQSARKSDTNEEEK